MKWILGFLALCSGMGANLSIADSTCFGETKNGRLENGVQLPTSGENFVTYSYLAASMGRTYVHSTVAEIVTAAYTELAATHPKKVYKYAETGFAEGARFKPHKTHQNGLSVDFMTPVVNDDGESVHLPTFPWNQFGYDIEFSKTGRYEGYTIDYEALAAHIVALDKAARAKGVGIWRVIFDPSLQPNLLATAHGQYIQQHIQLSTRKSWVRHDEHYHVDFDIPCQPL